jgi:hypothetical protein
MNVNEVRNLEAVTAVVGFTSTLYLCNQCLLQLTLWVQVVYVKTTKFNEEGNKGPWIDVYKS